VVLTGAVFTLRFVKLSGCAPALGSADWIAGDGGDEYFYAYQPIRPGLSIACPKFLLASACLIGPG